MLRLMLLFFNDSITRRRFGAGEHIGYSSFTQLRPTAHKAPYALSLL